MNDSSIITNDSDATQTATSVVHRLLADCLTPTSRKYLPLEESTNYPRSNLTYIASPYLPTDITTLQEEREQALRDYKVTIEYKHLKSHAPGGVYLVPTLSDLRHFHGIIFVRRGPFTNGVFKFQLTLPKKYNDKNQHPTILFSTPVYNPHVDPATGMLDIVSAYPVWDPSKHYLVTVLTFLKKIFYAKSFDDAVANQEAVELQATNMAAYRAAVDACVRESQRQVFQNDEASTAVFTEEELGHRVLRDLLKQNVKDPAQVSKQAILSMIDKASKV